MLPLIGKSNPSPFWKSACYSFLQVPGFLSPPPKEPVIPPLISPSQTACSRLLSFVYSCYGVNPLLNAFSALSHRFRSSSLRFFSHEFRLILLPLFPYCLYSCSLFVFHCTFVPSLGPLHFPTSPLEIIPFSFCW